MVPVVFLVVLSASLIPCGNFLPQSNYADQANNVEYIGGLPEQATLDGKVTKLDDLSPVIFLNRTKAALNCAAGSMQVELKFNEPFSGIAYADFDRNSPCQIHGKGGYSYKIELPLKGCGTKQSPQRVFTNNIHVRFSPILEVDGDEIITIVCRYPPAVAPLPPVLPQQVKVDNPPQPVIAPPLNSFQIMLIICGILFLSLLLLGLGCTNYCLRRRVIPLARPFSSIGTDSEITKLSSNLSMFDPVKIPRAHAPVQATVSSSGSEGPLISDTLPSDYPSESHSEIEEIDTRSLPASSAGSFENKAFVQDNSSVYSEGIVQTLPTLTAPPRIQIREQPKFDVQLKVNRAPPSPASLTMSDTDSSISRTERNLSTILEKEEAAPPVTQFTYIPELHHPPRHVQPAPTYNKILKRQQELEIDAANRKPEITSHTVDDVFLRTITEKRTIEDIERHKKLVTEYHTRPIDKWDVTIRKLEQNNAELPEWENFSDISSASGLTNTSSIPPERFIPPTSSIHDNKLPLNSPELVGAYVKDEEQNWNVLLRVLEPNQPEIEAEMQLTTSDKMKWRQIITTESTLRTLLTEAVVREDFERIRYDSRYVNLFEPPKWDVIIRILSPPQPMLKRYKKKVGTSQSVEWDTRSRRSSLPTLYESDGESSVRTLTSAGKVSDRRMSRSSYKSEADLRSMSEMTVDFGRPNFGDTESESSHYFITKGYEVEDEYYRSGGVARSLSQPSLARSASEFTEHWGAPSRYDTASEYTSPEATPKAIRRVVLPPSSQVWTAAQTRSVTSQQVSSSRQNWYERQQ